MDVGGLSNYSAYQNFDLSSKSTTAASSSDTASPGQTASVSKPLRPEKTAAAQTSSKAAVISEKTEDDLSLVEKQTKKIEEKMKQSAVDHANSRAKQIENNSIRFNYNDDINRVIISIVDQDTNKTVKEIPTEDTVSMLEKLHTFHGLLVDESR